MTSMEINEDIGDEGQGNVGEETDSPSPSRHFIIIIITALNT